MAMVVAMELAQAYSNAHLATHLWGGIEARMDALSLTYYWWKHGEPSAVRNHANANPSQYATISMLPKIAIVARPSMLPLVADWGMRGSGLFASAQLFAVRCCCARGLRRRHRGAQKNLQEEELRWG